jgi:hypothetical protein
MSWRGYPMELGLAAHVTVESEWLVRHPINQLPVLDLPPRITN